MRLYYNSGMETKISSYLRSLGILPNSAGYRYLFELSLLVCRGADILPLKHNGYRILGEKYGKTVETIDKNIQNCISKAFLRTPPEILYREFGQTIDQNKGKPTVKQFIFHLADRVKICG